MKSKNGFTLIELLAIIVILTIVMVIAVPQVLNVVNSSKHGAWKSNVAMIEKGIVKSAGLIDPETGLHKYSVKKLCNDTSLMPEVVKFEDTDILCTSTCVEGDSAPETPAAFNANQTGIVRLSTSKFAVRNEGRCDTWESEFILTGKNKFEGQKAFINCRNDNCSKLIRSNADLAGGLYDDSNKLLATWDELINVYHISPDGGYWYLTPNTKYENGKLYEYYYQHWLDDEDMKEWYIERGITEAGWYYNPGGPFLDESISTPTHLDAENIYISQKTYDNGMEQFLSDIFGIYPEEGDESIGITGPGWYYGYWDDEAETDVINWYKDENIIGRPMPSADYAYITHIGKNIAPGYESLWPTSIQKVGWYYTYNSVEKYIKNNSIPDPEDIALTPAYVVFSENKKFESATKLVIPGSVLEIERYRFSYCDSLKEIIISEGVRSIESEAFYYSQNIETIEIAESVSYIESDAFYGCFGLKNVIFGDVNGWNATDGYVPHNYDTPFGIKPGPGEGGDISVIKSSEIPTNLLSSTHSATDIIKYSECNLVKGEIENGTEGNYCRSNRCRCYDFIDDDNGGGGAK